MTRVVLLPSAYLPTLGGVQEMTRQLALALTRAGDTVEIWWQQDDEVALTTTESMDGLVVRRFPLPLPRADLRSIGPLLGAGRHALAAMRHAVLEFRPDVLHIHCFGPNGAYATLLSYLTGTPLVLTLHGETLMDDDDIYDHSATLRAALRLGIHRARLVTGCSQFTLDDAINRFGLRPERSVVIFNGVDLNQLRAAELDAGLTGRYVVAVGRAVEKKGFDLLLKGFARVAATFPGVTMAIAGDGVALPGLRDLADRLEISDRVKFLGRLPRDAVAAVMDGAEIFVMPSRLEPFGIVILEAWRSGRAVIASSRGGAPEFVEDGLTGLLVDPFDAPAVAGALERLLASEELRSSMGAAARARVEEFRWERVAERYRRLYHEVLSRPTQRRRST